MARSDRQALIREIERKRSSKVIAYVTSDRRNLSVSIASDVVSIMHEHLRSEDSHNAQRHDLFLYSRGGDSDVPWAIVSMFREYSLEGGFSVLIPYRAHSAATVISLGADEIVMGKKAELGPIDITISGGPYNPADDRTNQKLPVSVEDVTGYFALLERIGCARPEEKMKGFEELTKQVHPLVLGTVNRLLEQTRLVALRLLGTRSTPFSEEKNRQIVTALSSEIYSHRHTICRTEAINHLGLEQVVKAETVDVDNELWDLYDEYRTMFDLECPFSPEEYLLANDLEEHTWRELPLACIESMSRLDVCRKDISVRLIRSVPPQVTLNLQNLTVPSVNLPQLPEGLSAEQVMAVVQQALSSIVQAWLKQVAGEVAETFRKSLPVGQFQHVAMNSGWRTEV